MPREPEPPPCADVRGNTSAADEGTCGGAEENREALSAILDAALAEGIADAEAGRTVPIDEAFAWIRTELGWDEAGMR